MKPIVIGQPAKGIATITNSSGTTIYSSPSLQASILEVVPVGKYLPFIRKHSDQNGNDWYEVTLLDGNKGWLLGTNNALIQPAPDVTASLPLLNLSDAIITIDPGHGGSASGAESPTGFEEKVANRAIALRVKEFLIMTGVKATNIWMTRIDNDTDVSLAYRADLGTATGGHIFISIHNNSNSATSHGTETYYQCGKEQTAETRLNSNRLAKEVQQHLLASLANNTCGELPYDRGVKCRLGSKREDYYYVLRNTFIPAILTECVFISNPVEGTCLESDSFQSLLADGIGNGIIAYLTS